MKLITAPFVLSAAFALSDTVTITTGAVQGESGDMAVTFHGIPYGAPPSRWTAPEAAAAWEGTYDASANDYPACPQYCVDGSTLPTYMCPTEQSEDCLGLNVYAPLEDAAEPSPVVVFIHGGNFETGAAGMTPVNLYDGTYMANQTQTVVVTVNYRLGALGFMYDESAGAGNWGLADQRLALQWVQDNIGAFNGDPSRVTIMGQSAGAMSVASHLTMDASKDLFAQGVMLSDPFSLRFRTPDDASDFALDIAKHAGCRKGIVGHHKVDMECMRDLDVDDLIAAQVAAAGDIGVEAAHLLELFSPYVPTIGLDEFPERPLDAFMAGTNQDKPMMMGSVEEEGVMFIYGAFPDPDGTDPLPSWEVEAGLDVIFGGSMGKALREQFPMPESDDQHLYTSDVATEALFDCPIRNATRSAKQSAASYLYHVDHPASFGEAMWGANFTECWNVTCHGGELPFVFRPAKAEEFGYVMTDAEEDMSKSMRTYITNFAATGAPGEDQNGLAWPAFDGDLNSMLFQTPGNSIEEAHRESDCDFFDSWGYEWL